MDNTMSTRDFSTQSITPDEMLKMLGDIKSKSAPSDRMFGPPWMGFDFGKNEIGCLPGIKIQQAPPEKQKVLLSKSVTVSDEFREKYDSWLLDFFGMQESMFKSGEVLFMNTMNTMVMHPADIARLADISV